VIPRATRPYVRRNRRSRRIVIGTGDEAIPSATTTRVLAPAGVVPGRANFVDEIAPGAIDTEVQSLAPLLPGAWLDKPVTVIVPVIVLDELDGLKQRGDAPRKWRASYTLGVLEAVFSRSGTRGVLRQPAADGTRGALVMDIFFDPPGRERLPINDDEIIDRHWQRQAQQAPPSPC
jgi:hypothetical protein